MDGAGIKVVGIGTVGNDVLNKMVQRKVEEVDFVGIDVNQGNLDKLNVESKILVSENLSGEVQDVLKGTDLVFILTDVAEKENSEIAQIVSKAAKTMGILTIVVAATPINSNEEPEEIEKLKEVADTVIVLPLQKLAEANPDISFAQIFEKRDEIFVENVEFITNIINKRGVVDFDFDDVKGMLKDSGMAVTAFGKGEGEDKVKLAIEQVLNYPFVKNLSKKVHKIMINIVGGADLGLSEIQQIREIGEKFGDDKVNLLWGYNMDVELESKVELGVLMTDFTN